MLFLALALLLINSFLLTTMNPLSMGVAIMAQTLILSITAGLLLPSFWFSYILILTYLGGLLVLFIYVSALASNEQINVSMAGPVILTLVMAGGLLIITSSSSHSMINFSDNFFSNQTFVWMFSSSAIILAGFLMVYLFIALVAVVKITKWWGGSLRPNFKN